MEQILTKANEIIDQLNDAGFSDWEKDAVIDAAKLSLKVRLHTELDAMPKLVTPPSETSAASQ